MPNRLTESEKQLIHKLHEREHFIEEVANSTADVIYVLDLARGRIIYINKRVQTLMGADNMQLDAIHPQDYEKRCRHLDHCIQLKREEVREIALRFRVKSGAWNWFRVRDKAFKYNSDGN